MFGNPEVDVFLSVAGLAANRSWILSSMPRVNDDHKLLIGGLWNAMTLNLRGEKEKDE